MSTEKMRESFEAWHRIEYPGATLARRANGEYFNLYVGMCWIGWQASRAAIEVELPETDQFIDYPGYISRSDTEYALESLGLKVKP